MVRSDHSTPKRHALIKRAALLAGAARRLNENGRAEQNKTVRRKSPFSLAFLTDQRRISDPLAVIDALRRGGAVIFRDYDIVDREKSAIAARALCRRRGLLFYVAGDEALARRTHADGLHLPAHALLKTMKKPDGLLLSAACHTAADLDAAARLNADSVFLSPVFATKSHPDTEFLGADAFRKLAADAHRPVLALGGVTADNADQLAGPNVAGFGAIGAFKD